MNWLSRLFGRTKNQSHIPSIETILGTVKAIVAFVPDKNTFVKTAQQITEANSKGLTLTICGLVLDDTGRISIHIEGSIPKSEAVRFLQIINSLGGEINSVAG